MPLEEIKMENQVDQSMCASMHKSETERENVDISFFMQQALLALF